MMSFGLVLAVPDPVPEHLAGPSADTPVATTTAWETTRPSTRTLHYVAAEQVGKYPSQRSVGEGPNLGVEQGADPAHLGLGHSSPPAHGDHHVVDLAVDRPCTYVSLGDHRVQRPVDPPAA